MIKELERAKGGFSDAIVNTTEWKEYVVKRIKKGIPVFGYFGAPERTEEIDRIVEGYLIMKGLSHEAIVCWLTSTTARHFANNLYEGISKEEVIKLLDDYTKHIYLDLAIWNFPGYKGTLRDFDRIKEQIEKEVIKNESVSYKESQL